MPRRYRLSSHRWDSAHDPERVPLFLTLQWAHERSLAGMRPVLLRHGLTAAEFDVLATLRNADPPHRLTPTQIQDEVVITSGGLTKILLQLEARGLVTRQASAGDRRVKPVDLAETGRLAIEAAMADMVVHTGAWMAAALTLDETRRLTALLRKLVDVPLAEG